MRILKSLKLFLFSLTLILSASLPIHAEAGEVLQTEVEYLEDGDYIETVLITHPASARASHTTSGSKTSYYKNSSGTVLWSVTVTASFSYTAGKKSSCTSASGSSSSSSSNWKVSKASSSKSGNTATATATGTHYRGSQALNSYTRSVTLTCDTNGNLS